MARQHLASATALVSLFLAIGCGSRAETGDPGSAAVGDEAEAVASNAEALAGLPDECRAMFAERRRCFAAGLGANVEGPRFGAAERRLADSARGSEAARETVRRQCVMQSTHLRRICR